MSSESGALVKVPRPRKTKDAAVARAKPPPYAKEEQTRTRRAPKAVKRDARDGKDADMSSLASKIHTASVSPKKKKNPVRQMAAQASSHSDESDEEWREEGDESKRAWTRAPGEKPRSRKKKPMVMPRLKIPVEAADTRVDVYDPSSDAALVVGAHSQLLRELASDDLQMTRADALERPISWLRAEVERRLAASGVRAKVALRRSLMAIQTEKSYRHMDEFDQMLARKFQASPQSVKGVLPTDLSLLVTSYLTGEDEAQLADTNSTRADDLQKRCVPQGDLSACRAFWRARYYREHLGTPMPIDPALTSTSTTALRVDQKAAGAAEKNALVGETKSSSPARASFPAASASPGTLRAQMCLGTCERVAAAKMNQLLYADKRQRLTLLEFSRRGGSCKLYVHLELGDRPARGQLTGLASDEHQAAESLMQSMNLKWTRAGNTITWSTRAISNEEAWSNIYELVSVFGDTLEYFLRGYLSGTPDDREMSERTRIPLFLYNLEAAAQRIAREIQYFRIWRVNLWQSWPSLRERVLRLLPESDRARLDFSYRTESLDDCHKTMPRAYFFADMIDA